MKPSLRSAYATVASLLLPVGAFAEPIRGADMRPDFDHGASTNTASAPAPNAPANLMPGPDNLWIDYYYYLYPEFAAHFAADNKQAIAAHWFANGQNEGRSPNPFFDPVYYLSQYPDVRATYGENNYAAAMAHWAKFGVNEGRRGSPLFDAVFYLNTYPDVVQVYGHGNYRGAHEHYLRHGAKEGRQPTAEIPDTPGVKAMILATAKVGPKTPLENQKPETLWHEYYYRLYPDLHPHFNITDRKAIQAHWENSGRKEGRSPNPFYDPTYYRDQHSDLKRIYGNDFNGLHDHWTAWGIKEGRRGSEFFDAPAYLTTYSDVANAYGNRNYRGTYEHFMRHGLSEGRSPASMQITSEQKMVCVYAVLSSAGGALALSGQTLPAGPAGAAAFVGLSITLALPIIQSCPGSVVSAIAQDAFDAIKPTEGGSSGLPDPFIRDPAPSTPPEEPAAPPPPPVEKKEPQEKPKPAPELPATDLPAPPAPHIP